MDHQMIFCNYKEKTFSSGHLRTLPEINIFNIYQKVIKTNILLKIIMIFIFKFVTFIYNLKQNISHLHA